MLNANVTMVLEQKSTKLSQFQHVTFAEVHMVPNGYVTTIYQH